LHKGKFGTLCEMVREKGADQYRNIIATMHVLML
jgi:hypothetical protein